MRVCVCVYKYVHVCIYIRGEGEGRCIDSHVLPVGTRKGSEVYKSKHQVKALDALCHVLETMSVVQLQIGRQLHAVLHLRLLFNPFSSKFSLHVCVKMDREHSLEAASMTRPTELGVLISLQPRMQCP